MRKAILLIMLALAITMCSITFVYGFGSTTRVTPNPAIPGTLLTATWTPTTDNPSTEVTFVWKNPSGTTVQTNSLVAVSPMGTPVSVTYQLPNNAPIGKWWVEATAYGPNGEIEVYQYSYEVAPFVVAVPEIATLGTIGAVVAMIGAVVYTKKRSNKN